MPILKLTDKQAEALLEVALRGMFDWEDRLSEKDNSPDRELSHKVTLAHRAIDKLRAIVYKDPEWTKTRK